jgi:activator of HSP90 ATPase
MTTTSILQHVRLPVPPDEVYALLLDAGFHASLSSLPAEVEPEEGGTFALQGGAVHGRNQRLGRNAEIVQSWILAHPDWPPGHLSELSMLLERSGRGGGETLVHLYHTEIPLAAVYEVERFWNRLIWPGLRARAQAPELAAV